MVKMDKRCSSVAVPAFHPIWFLVFTIQNGEKELIKAFGSGLTIIHEFF
jgi:hypothetical protein